MVKPEICNRISLPDPKAGITSLTHFTKGIVTESLITKHIA